MNVQVATKDSFEKLAQNMGEMIESIYQSSYVGFRPDKAWEPPVNVYEQPDCLIVCVELAGMRREDIDVEVGPGRLIVQGVRPDPQLPKSDTPCRLHLLEIHQGPFARTIALPSEFDVGNTQAQYREGYLWIRVPKGPTQQTE